MSDAPEPRPTCLRLNAPITVVHPATPTSDGEHESHAITIWPDGSCDIVRARGKTREDAHRNAENEACLRFEKIVNNMQAKTNPKAQTVTGGW